MSRQKSRKAFDAVIVGGGPSGAAAALSLSQEGVERVLVVEASAYEQPRIGESIPPNTRQLLAELSALEAFLAEGHEACFGSCSSWGSDELGYNDFALNLHGHGWHLDRRRFDAFLAHEVERRGVELRRETRLSSVVLGRTSLKLQLKDKTGKSSQVSARFVIDATGRRASCARRLGGRRQVHDSLVVSAVYFELPDSAAFSKLTLLEAVEYGYWYAARLPDRRIAVALATSHTIHKQRGFQRGATFRQALVRTRHLVEALAPCKFVQGSLSVSTAPSFILEPLCGSHWLAVGDSASSYDPISSQGIFKALNDGLRGGQAVAQYLKGNASALAEHQYRVRLRFLEYQEQRAHFYNLERRWEDSPFWSERRQAGKGFISPANDNQRFFL